MEQKPTVQESKTHIKNIFSNKIVLKEVIL